VAAGLLPKGAGRCGLQEVVCRVWGVGDQEAVPGAATRLLGASSARAQVDEVEEAGFRRLVRKMRAVVAGEGAARLAGAVVEEEGAARQSARR
jgi:hypothetical protein